MKCVFLALDQAVLTVRDAAQHTSLQAMDRLLNVSHLALNLPILLTVSLAILSATDASDRAMSIAYHVSKIALALMVTVFVCLSVEMGRTSLVYLHPHLNMSARCVTPYARTVLDPRTRTVCLVWGQVLLLMVRLHVCQNVTMGSI